MTKSTFAKTKAQIKSSSYYLFWGAATVAVVAGQIYVGSGYRSLAKSLDKWMDVAVEALINDYRSRTNKGYYMPVPTPDDYGMTIIE